MKGANTRTPKSTHQDKELVLLKFCRTPRRRAEMQEKIGLKDVQNFRMNYLWPLLERGLLEMTIPESPTSRLQKYRTTVAGATLLTEKD